jgi:hypothetical protein
MSCSQLVDRVLQDSKSVIQQTRYVYKTDDPTDLLPVLYQKPVINGIPSCGRWYENVQLNLTALRAEANQSKPCILAF